MKNYLREYVENSTTVGIAVGLVDHDNIETIVCGKKSVSAEEPVTKETLFEIGSVTKLFTTSALMELVAKGELHLDDPIETFLPDMKIPERDGKKITLRHLVTHTAGFPYFPDDPDFSIEKLNQCALQSAPGEKYAYSHLGVGLLGYILSVKTSLSYEETVRELVLDRLGMNSTVIVMPNSLQKQLSQGHHLRIPMNGRDPAPLLQAASAFRSNIVDMTAFVAENLRHFSECHRPQHAISPSMSIGYGWHISVSGENEIIWHNGSTGGFVSYAGFSPKLQRGIVILMNSSESLPNALGDLIFGFLDPKSVASQPIDESLMAVEYLRQFEGDFAIAPQGDLRLALYGKQLVFSSAGWVAAVTPLEQDTFGFKGLPDYKCQFMRDENQTVVKIQMIGPNGVQWEAIRK